MSLKRFSQVNGSSSWWTFNVVTEMQPPVNAFPPPCAGVWQWGDLSLAHSPVCPLEPLLGTGTSFQKHKFPVYNSYLILVSELVLNAKPPDFLLLSWYFASRLVSRGCLPALEVMDSMLWSGLQDFMGCKMPPQPRNPSHDRDLHPEGSEHQHTPGLLKKMPQFWFLGALPPADSASYNYPDGSGVTVPRISKAVRPNTSHWCWCSSWKTSIIPGHHISQALKK